ncbi:MAG TPA: T9SS type A sorting domain-containing protein, partial [Chryseosolibacter sp.]
MSSVSDASIFRQNQQGKVAHMPIWIFQGGKDTRPTPAFTAGIVSNLQKAGAVVRYSLYADLGHVVWNRAYAESDYFTWMLSKSKANLHAFAGNTVIDKSKGRYVKLMLAEGFLAYQWQKDGVTVSGANANTYTATVPGTYRARFSRKSAVPTEAQWNRWSAPVTVTQVTTTALAANTAARTSSPSDAELVTAAEASGEFSFSVYPNPGTAGSLSLRWEGAGAMPVEVRLVDQLGREVYAAVLAGEALRGDRPLALPASTRGGMYILVVSQGRRQERRRVMLREGTD